MLLLHWPFDWQLGDAGYSVHLGIMALIPFVQTLPNFTLELWFSSEHMVTLNDVLPYLGINDQVPGASCVLNQWIFPLDSSPDRTLAPPLPSLQGWWCPGDAALTEDKRFHFLIGQHILYQEMIRFSSPGPLNLCPYNADRTSWRRTFLTLSFVGVPDLIHATASAHHQINMLQDDISTLKRQVRLLKNKLGMALETIASHTPALAGPFGLNARPVGDPMATDDPDQLL